MTYSPPGNPVHRHPSRIRIFDGISGPETKVLRRTNDKGWELSNSVANDVQDVNLGRRGTMLLRMGSRKVDDTGKADTIEALVSVRIAGALSYGMVYGGTMTLVAMPRFLKPRTSILDLVPAQTFPSITNDSITEFPGEQL